MANTLDALRKFKSGQTGTGNTIESLRKFKSGTVKTTVSKPKSKVDVQEKRLNEGSAPEVSHDEWRETEKAKKRLEDVRQYVFKQGLEKLDEKYKDTNLVQRASMPEYQADVKALAESVGYDTTPKERNQMYNPEATQSTLPYLGEKAKMGLIEFASGLSKLSNFGDDGIKTLSPAQQMQLRQDIDRAEFQMAEQENVSPALRTVGNVVQATTAMIPNIILSAANPAMGLAQIGLSSAGSSAHEALREGANKKQALAYGALSGGIEAGTESLFGALPFMKGIGDKVTNKLIEPIKNKLIKAGIRWTMNMGEEALEEGISGVLDPFAKRLTYNKSAPMATPAEIAEQMLIGGAVAGILGIPGTVADATGKQVPIINDIKGVDNGVITFDMADGSTLELNPSEMEPADLQVLKNSMPKTVESDTAKKVKAAIDNAAEQKGIGEVQQAQPIGRTTSNELETLKLIRMGLKKGTDEYNAISNIINRLEGKTETTAEPVQTAMTPEPATEPTTESATPTAEKPMTTTEAGKTQAQQVSILASRPTGRETTMKTNDGQDIKARYAVVDIGELITSHNTDLTVNKDYPQELQPRQRDRAAAVVEVEKMANNIQPELLGENIKVSDGAPIVGDDFIVESGNGRTIALKKAYESGKAEAYRKWLNENKERFGIEGELPKNPVLVRVRTTDVDRPTFAKQANESSVAAMSATETAKSDAEKMSDSLIRLFVPNDEGAINTADNKTFIQRFMNEIIPSNEHVKYVTKEGLLSQDGYNRIRNALFYKAYEDVDLVDNLTEDLDSNLKNVIKAMVANAPKISAIKDGIKNGTLYNLDFSSDIVYAAKKAIELKRTGTKVDEFVNQTSMFEGPTDVQREILLAFDKNNRSAKRITSLIRYMTEGVENAGNPNQISLFDGKKPTKDDIMEYALRRLRNEVEGTVEGQTTLPILETGYESSSETGRTAAAERTTDRAEGRTAEQVSEQVKTEPAKSATKAESKTVPEQFKGKEPGEPGYKPIKVGMQVQIVSNEGKTQLPKFEYADPELEAIHQKNKGVHKETFVERTKNALTEFTNMFTRPIRTLPYTPENANLYYEISKIPTLPKRAADDTVRTLESIVGKLNKEEFNMFERKIFLDDLAEEVRLGNKLPNKWTPEKVENELKRLDEYMTPATKEAVKKRKEFMDNLVKEFIEAKALVGVDESKTFTRENYFRHQVLEHMDLKNRIKGTGKRLRTPTGENFTRARSGQYEGDINTDYLQAEFEVMAQMKTNILICQMMHRIDNGYNIADVVKSNAKAEGLEDWHDAIPEGYTTWQPIPGNVFYMYQPLSASLVTESLALRGLKLSDIKDPRLKVALEDIMNDLAEQTALLAMGGKRKEWVVKQEVADTLNNLNRMQPSHILSRASKKIQNGWKRWVTSLNPKSTIKFGIRNFSGDLEAVLQGNTGSVKRIPRAVIELREAVVNGKFTPELKAWYDEGGYQALMYPQEVSGVNKLKTFEKFRENITVAEKITKPLRAYAEFTEDMHNFREAVLRYATFLDYLEQLNNGKLKNYGASKPEVIDALDGNERKAFKLANDLLGAYDEVSEAGKWLRSHMIPFYSWMEINFKRNIRLIRNVFTDPEISTAKKAGVTAGLAAKIGAKGLWKLSKLFLMTAALSVWNYLMYKDLEDELPEDVRQRPHIILGRDKDGNVLYFSRLGAMNDFLEWFGLDTAEEDVRDVMNGKMTIAELLVNMAKAPVNKIASGISPFFKTPAELATGKSFYPDVFNLKTIRDRWQYIAQSLGLRDEYDVLAGKPHRPYFENLSKALLYKADPKESAYYAILDLKSKYKAKKGEESGTFFTTKKSNALYNYKLALRYGDKKAQEKYLKEYESYGGNPAQTIESVLTMSPYYGIRKDEREDFKNSLTGKDKEKLKLAEEFFVELLENELASKRPLSDGTKAMIEIYKKTGETKQFPKVVSGEMTVNGKKIKLTQEEVAEFQRRADEAMYKAADELVQNPAFKKKSPEEQAELMSNALNQAVATERAKWKAEKYLK